VEDPQLRYEADKRKANDHACNLRSDKRRTGVSQVLVDARALVAAEVFSGIRMRTIPFLIDTIIDDQGNG
jgi:hypothetical protein